jgi:hypothetical protein
MESIYYVVSYVCHRRCKHCYEERFRPYAGAELAAQVAQAAADSPRIVDHLPERLTYLDRAAPRPDGSLIEKVGRIILAGGEVLHEPVRETVTYPLLSRLFARYRGTGPGGQAGVRLIVQTTGDLLTEAIVESLLRREVWMISVSGFDDYHVGFEGEATRARLRDKLVALFAKFGMRPSGSQAPNRSWNEEDGPVYSFFGATEDTWIGKLWPRGRAWENGLSRATLADNFCNRWSGGLQFLEHRYDGSEVSIEPGGDVFPCCLKTRLPIGNLTEEPLLDILDSLRGDPIYEAISTGRPERMGLTHGWSVQTFLEKSKTRTPGGLPYENLCIGCDRFHEEILRPIFEARREARRAARLAGRYAAPQHVRDAK